MHRRTGGACSASGGEAVCSGVTHRIGRGEARMGFDPGDGQVVMPADSGEKAPDSLNEGLGLMELSPMSRTQYSLSVRRLMRLRATVEEGPSPPQTEWRAGKLR